MNKYNQLFKQLALRNRILIPNCFVYKFDEKVNDKVYRISEIYEKENKIYRIIRRYVYSIEDDKTVIFEFYEQWSYKSLIYSSTEEKSISKIYDSKHNLIAYKFQYGSIFYSYPYSQNFDNHNISNDFKDSNDNDDELLKIRDNLRQMTIEKIDSSFTIEYSQRKSETEIILNAYRLRGKKKNCYILPINNNNYKIIDNSYFDINKPDLKQFVKDLNLPNFVLKDTFQEHKTFIVLPIKYQSHMSILIISHHDTLYYLDSQFNKEYMNDLFTSKRLKIKPLMKEKLQKHYTCCYWVEGMLSVISMYSSIEEIIDECKTHFFEIKVISKICEMFEKENARTIVIPSIESEQYKTITIQNKGKEMKISLFNGAIHSKYVDFFELCKLFPQFNDYLIDIDKHTVISLIIQYENDLLNEMNDKVDEELNEKIFYYLSKDVLLALKNSENSKDIFSKSNLKSLKPVFHKKFKDQKDELIKKLQKSYLNENPLLLNIENKYNNLIGDLINNRDKNQKFKQIFKTYKTIYHLDEKC